MAIDFVKWYGASRFYITSEGEKEIAHRIEFRKDPLLGHVSIYSDAIYGKREIMFPHPDEEYIRQQVERTKSSCFLCDGKWKITTPKYPDNLIPGGRLLKNECVLFPNLFPISDVHAVIMVGNKHYLGLDEFSASLLYDALCLSFEFIKRVASQYPNIRYFTVNANYLAPAGASLMHPHLQVLGSAIPSTQHVRLLAKSKEFFEKVGKSYWAELVDEERKREERYIGEYRGLHLLAAYSPLGVNEILGIMPDIPNFGDLDDENTMGLAKAISDTLYFYKSIGFSTFNFSFLGEKMGVKSEHSACVLRLICRQNMVPDHRTDDYYFQKLLGNEIMVIPPEKLAKLFRETLHPRKPGS